MPHPRYRRALIPALLVALLVVVLVAALVRRAQAAEDGTEPRSDRVGTITDRRVPESSGLVMSTSHPALAYTVNDSGNDPVVYAIRVSTGDVVGATRLSGDLEDVEALAIDQRGTLWVADIGDNNEVRHRIALYAIDQPARGERTVEPERYAVRYADGRHDAETLLADPGSGAMFVVTKGFLGGRLYRLPDRLSTEDVNVLRPVKGAEMPVMVTDGDYLRDGTRVLIRTYGSAYAYDPTTWERTWSGSLPEQRQGESLATEPGGRSFLVGTEGLPSPILRVTLPRSERGASAQVLRLLRATVAWLGPR